MVRPMSAGSTLVMTNTIVASSHSVTIASSSLRVMKRAIGYVTVRARGANGSARVAGRFRVSMLDGRGCRDEHLSESARVDARELLGVAGEIVVPVRDGCRDILVHDGLDLGAGGLLGINADRALELLEGRVELLGRVLRGVPGALRLERRVQKDIRTGPVAVVDDAEFGGAGARRIG